MTRDLLRMAEATGWTVSRTRGDHLKLVHPDADRPVFAASTPSCPRALANTLATMKLVLPTEAEARQAPDRAGRRDVPATRAATATPTAARRTTAGDDQMAVTSFRSGTRARARAYEH